MSLPGLDSGAVRVNHAWEAAAPWQVSCEEGEMVYRVGDESEDGWVEVQRARATAREGPSRPPTWAARSFPRQSRRRGVSAVRGCRRRGVSAAPLPDAPDGWLVHGTDQGVLYYQLRRWSRSVGATHAGGVGPAPRGGRRGAHEGRRREARRVAQGPFSIRPCGAPLPPRCSTSARPLPEPPARRRDRLPGHSTATTARAGARL